MTRKSFVQVCNLKFIFVFIAAFTLVAAFTASAQEAGSAPDYDRPWQHFAQPGAGESQGSPGASDRVLRTKEAVSAVGSQLDATRRPGDF